MQRLPLPVAAQSYLDQRQQTADQQHADGTLDIERRWADARQTQAISGTADSVLATLRQMAGQGARCMYCSDSRGTDIEHFRPKATYPAQAFRWPNLLLCCSACGRLKGARFPLDPTGEPLFIDPSHDDPWAHLNFVPETGALMPREWRDADLVPHCSEKGRWTAQILLGDERIQDGWRRTWRHIGLRIRDFLAQPGSAEQLLQDLREEDTRGLLPWCFGPVGQTYSPFSELRERHPTVWQICETRLAPAP